MQAASPILTQLLKLLEDNQAQDVQVIDVKEQTAITDYMVIASGRSSRHIHAIAQKTSDDMKAAGFAAVSSTGLQSCDWVLIDFVDIIVHIMLPESRSYYDLEGLWQHPSS